MDFYVFLAIILYFVFLLFIGKYSYNKNANMSEFLLDNRKLGPIVTALSAGASDMSGWMLLGLPGALYVSGLANIWIVVGLCLGAFANYSLVAKRLRIYTEISGNSLTLPDFLENRFGDDKKKLRLLAGFTILVFFTLYVSSGILAGGKSFESFFGLPFSYGAILTFVIVVFYTFFGGFKAVCITDAFQGTLMFLVLIAVPLFAFLNLDESLNFINEIKILDKNKLDIFYNQNFWSIFGLLAWGFGYFGQPHIIVRFMAIRSHKELNMAKYIGILWMILGLFGAIMSGLVGFVFFNQKNISLSDPEFVFLELSKILFHPFFIGIVISAVLAAIMSTISSQLLVSASSISKDFILAFSKKDFSEEKEVSFGRYAVVTVAIVAFFLAFLSKDSVLSGVAYAWAGFGASFGPVILFSLYWDKMTAKGAFFGMLVGGSCVILWRVFGFNVYVYEMLPGIILSSITIIMVSLVDKNIKPKFKKEFDTMKKELNEN